MRYIGIDLGTSTVKLLLMDETGKIYGSVTREYPLEFPQPGWSQQNPADWWNAVTDGMRALLAGTDVAEIAGIGVAGQMQGLVILDENDEVIRPVILWNDGRTAAQVDYLNRIIGKEKLASWTANIAFAGFTAPKLLWLRENEPENFRKIRKIMLPKDYINFKLTGVHSTDYSDASGTLLLDVEHKCWSREMLEICGISESLLPKLRESYQCIGHLLPETAKLLGLPETVKVCAGAGDNEAAAVGTGVIGEGGCNISLGTSGTVFTTSEHFIVDKTNSIHAHVHADGSFHLLGAILSAASCNKWLMDEIFKTADYPAEQAAISENMLGENRVFFLPYLMGERSPINDTNARGTFIGMGMDTTRADMTQAVLEGVAFAIRDCVEVVRGQGIVPSASKICGGGAKSLLWKRILANVLNMELESPASEQGPSMGGAMLAMVACGEYATVRDAVEAIVLVASTVKPEPVLVEKYQRQYEKYRQIYPAVKNLFPKLQ